MIKAQFRYSRKHNIAAAGSGAVLVSILMLAVIAVFDYNIITATVEFLKAALDAISFSPVLLSIIGIATVYFVISINIVIFKIIMALCSFYSKKDNDGIIEMTFLDDRMVWVISLDTEIMTITSSYGAVTEAFERKGYFAVCTKEKRLALAYRDITEGTPEELRKLLAEKVGSKFKVK